MTRSARQLLVTGLASQDDRDDAEHGKAGHDPRRLVKPPSCTTSRPAANGPKMVMTRPEPLQNATAVEPTWVGNSSDIREGIRHIADLKGRTIGLRAIWRFSPRLWPWPARLTRASRCSMRHWPTRRHPGRRGP